jgi:hypothetical protein
MLFDWDRQHLTLRTKDTVMEIADVDAKNPETGTYSP